VTPELNNVQRGTQHLIFSLKEKKLRQYIREKEELLKTATYDETQKILTEIRELSRLKIRVNKLLGRIVTK
jgi:hypothetical protein